MNNPEESEKKKMLNPTLPHELIEEILLRLPVKSVLRFKCVCKSWLSLISDSDFAKSHFDLAANPTYRYLIKSILGVKVISIDIESSLDDLTPIRTHVLPQPLSQHQFDDSAYHRVLIYASCRGFLLMHYDHHNLIVWNPSTGLAKSISYPHSMYDFLYGFWYDDAADDYLVILMAVYKTPHGSIDWKTHIEIFSLKTNSWEQIEGFKFPYWKATYNAEAGLLLNGALHWLVFSCHNREHVIIAFDLVEMSLVEIHIPQDVAVDLEMEPRRYYLRVLGGCLSLCYPGAASAPAEIWMMKKYKVQSSWTKSFVLPIHYDIRNENYVLPVCSTKSDGLIGFNRDGGLMKYDNKGVSIEYTTFDPDFHTYDIQQSAIYRESILSLPGEFGEASEDDQQ